MPDLQPYQQDLVNRIAQELHLLLPDGFDAATARFRVLTGLGQIEGIASCGDGTTLVFSGFGGETIEALKQLRQAMYTPQTGAWLSGSITVTRRGYADSQFSYDEEPRWTREVTGDDYARDLVAFPRQRTAVPDWLWALLPADFTLPEPQPARPDPPAPHPAEPGPAEAPAVAAPAPGPEGTGPAEPAPPGLEPSPAPPAPGRVVAWVDQVVALDWPMTLADLAEQAPALGWSVGRVTTRQASFTTEDGLAVEARARDGSSLTWLRVRLADDETRSHEENRGQTMTYLGALRGRLGPEERFEHPRSPSLSRTWIPPHHVQIHLKHEDGQVSAEISLTGLMWLQEREERQRHSPT